MEEYYARQSIDEPVDCSCGAPLQTREHILVDCPQYATWRHLLQKHSPALSPTAILGTKEGIKVLSAFIAKSGAFTKSGEPDPQLEDGVP